MSNSSTNNDGVSDKEKVYEYIAMNEPVEPQSVINDIEYKPVYYIRQLMNEGKVKYEKTKSEWRLIVSDCE